METETPAAGPWRYFTAGLLLAVLLLYGPALGFGYVWDDEIIILKNADLQRPALSWALLGRPVLEDTSYFRPLVFLSWWLAYRALGMLSPALSHAVNLGLFYLALLLCYRLFQRVPPGPAAPRLTAEMLPAETAAPPGGALAWC